jgi:glutamyl-tRNA synthetase
MQRVRGRLAPSPTGYLHIGNAWAFLWAWVAARHEGGQVVLRMEDIDPQRSRPEYAHAILEDLRWLGLDWDEGPDIGGSYGPYTQQERLSLYQEVLCSFTQRGIAYPCFCTRKELRSLAGAPHWGDAGAAYSGTCRGLSAAEIEAKLRSGRRPALRLLCPCEPVVFNDALYGQQQCTLQEIGGDFALCRSDGVVAYQLAVAVDDHAMGITQVVRGKDILVSTPRQIALMRLLGAQRIPQYGHIALLLDEQGERLAKRHNSMTLRSLRQQGMTAPQITGLLAYWAGLQTQPVPRSAAALIPLFDWHRLVRHNVSVPSSLCAGCADI